MTGVRRLAGIETSDVSVKINNGLEKVVLLSWCCVEDAIKLFPAYVSRVFLRGRGSFCLPGTFVAPICQKEIISSGSIDFSNSADFSQHLISLLCWK